jgi:hypothetical protein
VLNFALGKFSCATREQWALSKKRLCTFCEPFQGLAQRTEMTWGENCINPFAVQGGGGGRVNGPSQGEELLRGSTKPTVANQKNNKTRNADEAKNTVR